MRHYAFRLLNVFSESTFEGNPLCVFEDASGLSDAEMQLLARQFNLSETTFLLPSDVADKRVRVFTPGAEMRFAGHPAIGSAHVVRALGAHAGVCTTLTLAFDSGVVPLQAEGDHWTFMAPAASGATVRHAGIDRATAAAWFGLDVDEVAAEPVWVDTGSDQLLIPVRDAAAITRARPDASRTQEWPTSSIGRRTAYLFEIPPIARTIPQAGRVRVRYFFVPPAGGVAEDPGTGSACANLGGWWLASAKPTPMHAIVMQGVEMNRACRLQLHVDAGGAIYVGGQARELGRGTIML